jgi:hypothetical protein
LSFCPFDPFDPFKFINTENQKKLYMWPKVIILKCLPRLQQHLLTL